MAEQFCDVGRGITLCYETFGDPGDPPMLLIMGLATQMIGWPDEFCEQLAGRGFQVVRFDNRDSGRSTHVPGRPPPLGQLVRRRIDPVLYTLSDMADDALGLMRALELEPAHVVGASMGGMIAQTLAAEHPEAVRIARLDHVQHRQPLERAARARAVSVPAARRRPPIARASSSTSTRCTRRSARGAYRATRSASVMIAARSYDRGHDPAASGRQLGAITASGNRTAALRRITAPTLVIHGTDDRLVRPSGGRATARAIPGADC